MLHVQLVSHQRQDVGSSLPVSGFFGCNVVTLTYIDTKKLRSRTDARQHPPSQEIAVYERPPTLLVLWLTCRWLLAHSYNFGLSNWAQTTHVWYVCSSPQLDFPQQDVFNRHREKLLVCFISQSNRFLSIWDTESNDWVIWHIFLAFQGPVGFNGAATLTTLQQRGQNHHMRARAKRMSSTRKTIATTVPSD